MLFRKEIKENKIFIFIGIIIGILPLLLYFFNYGSSDAESIIKFILLGYSVIIAMVLVARERQNDTLSFLCALPVSRAKILFNKYVVGGLLYAFTISAVLILTGISNYFDFEPVDFSIFYAVYTATFFFSAIQDRAYKSAFAGLGFMLIAWMLIFYYIDILCQIDIQYENIIIIVNSIIIIFMLLSAFILFSKNYIMRLNWKYIAAIIIVFPSLLITHCRFYGLIDTEYEYLTPSDFIFEIKGYGLEIKDDKIYTLNVEKRTAEIYDLNNMTKIKDIDLSFIENLYPIDFKIKDGYMYILNFEIQTVFYIIKIDDSDKYAYISFGYKITPSMKINFYDNRLFLYGEAKMSKKFFDDKEDSSTARTADYTMYVYNIKNPLNIEYERTINLNCDIAAMNDGYIYTALTEFKDTIAVRVYFYNSSDPQITKIDEKLISLSGHFSIPGFLNFNNLNDLAVLGVGGRIIVFDVKESADIIKLSEQYWRPWKQRGRDYFSEYLFINSFFISYAQNGRILKIDRVDREDGEIQEIAAVTWPHLLVLKRERKDFSFFASKPTFLNLYKNKIYALVQDIGLLVIDAPEAVISAGNNEEPLKIQKKQGGDNEKINP